MKNVRVCVSNFHPNSTGLALLFIRQILNSSKDFFLCDIIILIYFFRCETIDTDAHAFFIVIILSIVGVYIDTRAFLNGPGGPTEQ
jgi:hypothetical protein